MRWEDCVKKETERLGGEWRTTAKYRSWRLLIHNVVREKRGQERKDEEKMTVTMDNVATGTTRGG